MKVAATAVIVTVDAREVLLSCLSSLPKGVLEAVVVVDNGSRDGTQEAVRTKRPDVQILRLDEPVGFARACNLGAAHARSPYILFLNSDIVVQEGAPAMLVKELDGRPDAVAAGGRLVDPGTDDTQYAYLPKRFPTTASLALELTGVARIWPGNPVTDASSGAHLSETQVAEVDQPAGACLLIRRERFQDVGGFDEGYWFWYEDVDLARRLKTQGVILYVPRATFEHLGGASFRRWTRARLVRSRFHGLLRYLRQHAEPGQQSAVAFTMLVVLTVRVAVSRGQDRRAYAAAWLASAELLARREAGRGAGALHR